MAVSSPVGDVKIVSPISTFVLNALTLKETEKKIFFFWSSRMVNLLQPVRLTKTLPVRSTTQICVVTRHQYCARFSKVISRGETSSGVVKCRLFPRTSTRHEEARGGASGFLPFASLPSVPLARKNELLGNDGNWEAVKSLLWPW